MLLAVEKFQAVLFEFGKSQAQPFRPFTKRVSHFIHRKIPGKGTNDLHRDSRYLVGFIIPYVLADRIVVLKAVHRAAAER